MSLFDKAKEALNSDQAEELTDKVLDKAEEVAKDKLGEEHTDKIDTVRDTIDSKLGNE
ncbi:antitoxin [Arcanobacterium pinnipediorum]|uniref:Antitoxin n=1 Tax=Arcanobacterium pinnipediorum TaxID=1503041 RepID=A0ABY5AI76_9ACTO|nr:antitoxin [Arcanobacterium pinnipediorum]USR79560.1 antitoxin [Arcanobacterium pinnipediorum]